jgi:Na+/proline symporter
MDLTTLFPLFSQTTGWLLVGLYGLVVFALTAWYVKGYADNKTSFLVARREIGGLAGAMSTAAAWAWAPALFISAQMAYMNGIAGLFWFTIGNFLSLIIFGLFVHKIRASQPMGFTLPGYIKEKFSSRVQNIFLLELWMLASCAFAINALAGSQAVQTITSINYHFVTIALAGIALLYALRGGLKASVITEIFKIVVLWAGILVVIPWAWSAAGGSAILTTGFGGITGNGASLVNDFALGVFMAVGMSTALGHLGAPWGDNGFYQRAFAIKQDRIKHAFIGGAFIFVFVPLMIGSLGFVAAGAGLEIPKELVGMTTVITIGSFLPSWTVLIVLFMLLAGLVAVLDSQLNSAASLVGHDIKNKFSNDSSEAANIKWSRGGMLALATMALVIANWPGMTLLTIFLFFGVMRATVWWPMMLHLWKPELISERGMFWGIVIAFIIGFPMFVYGQQFGGGAAFTMAGTLIAIFGSGILASLITAVNKNKTIELISNSQ